MILNAFVKHMDSNSTFTKDFKDPSTMAIANKFKHSGLITHVDEFDSSHLQFAAPLVHIILWEHMYIYFMSISYSSKYRF